MTYDKNSIVFEPLPTHPNFKNIINQVFGRLTVLGVAGRNQGSKVMWWCECMCGNICQAAAYTLTSGHTASCGCFRRETTTVNNTTHGVSKTHPLYPIWLDMRDRCNNPRNDGYANYGERGIKVCQRWDDFMLFAQDMGDRPSKQHSIDRRNNDGHYEPSNCYWATRLEQSHNKRNNVHITYNGETCVLMEWERRTGIDHHTIQRQLKVLGWSVERTLTTPPKTRRKATASSST